MEIEASGGSAGGTLTIGAGAAFTDAGYMNVAASANSYGLLQVQGGTLTQNNFLSVGTTGNGTMIVSSGGVVNSSAPGGIGYGSGIVGDAAGSIGQATITGAGSVWNNAGILIIGNAGNGQLTTDAEGLVQTQGLTIVGNQSGAQGTVNVQDGSTFNSFSNSWVGNSSGSIGVVNVTGAGSQWNTSGTLEIGLGGQGSMNVTSGGVVTSSLGIIGDAAGASGTVSVVGSGSQWNDSGYLVVGGNSGASNGSLYIQAGGVVNDTNGYIGFSPASSGSVIVTGAGSQWNNSGFLDIGENGQGVLTIQNGGVVNSTINALGDAVGGAGTVTVSGAGSQWNASGFIAVGGNNGPGFGSLTIEKGGVVNSSYGLIGTGNGGTGIVTVTGAGSQWNNSYNVVVGGGASPGSGTMTISAGGVVSDTYAYIASALGSTGTTPLPGSTGTVTVTGAGSKWINSEQLAVGSNGTGFLTISQGAIVTSQIGPSVTGSSGIIGGEGTASAGYTSGTGTVTVASGGEWNQDGALRVGFSAGSSGTLTIMTGGQVNDYAGSIGYLAGSTGVVLVTDAGSQWNNSTTLDVGTAGTGFLTVEDGGSVSDTDATVGGSGGSGTVIVDGATWTNSGSLDIGVGGAGSVPVENGGSLTAGDTTVGSSGTLTLDPSTANINGDFTLDSGGLLTLDVGGATLYSQLDITGFGLFDGTVLVDFVDGFAPQTGNSFDLINTGTGIDFTGATFEIEGLAPGFEYSENFANGDFTLEALNNAVSSSEPRTLYPSALVMMALLAAGIGRRRARNHDREVRP